MNTTPTPSDWKLKVQNELGDGVSLEEALVSRTLEGLAIDPLLTADNASAGHSAIMPSGGGWAITPRIEHPSPRLANGRALEELEGGAGGLELNLARIRLESLEDARRLLDGVLLDAIPIALTSQADALPLAGLLLAYAEERELKQEALAFHFGLDPFASLARDGELPGDLEDARRDLHTLASFSRLHLDGCRTACADGSAWHRMGADAALELGLTIASFVESLRWLEQDGLPVAASHSEFVWRLDLDADVFGGIAKCRAARLLQAKVLGAAGIEQGTSLVLHATTSPRVMTVQDAWTNMLRSTLGVFAGAAGGADLITSLPFDGAIVGAADEELESSPLARRVARNAQLVLQMESRLDHVGDPGGGGFFVESMTQELSGRAWAHFQRIEAAGGIAESLTTGLVNELIGESRERLEAAYRNGDRHLIGVSAFPPPEGAEEPAGVPMERDAADAGSSRSTPGSVVLGAIDSVPHLVQAAAEGATRTDLGSARVRGAAKTARPIESIREEPMAQQEVSA